MSFTRLYDDKEEKEFRLKQSIGQGRYQLNVPGNGMTPDYMEDPHYRLEHWAGNLGDNAIDLESDLRCLTRNLNRDEIQKNTHLTHDVEIKRRSMSSLNNATTDQSRVTHPGWHYRDIKQHRDQYLLYNPQDNAIVEFTNNVSSRYEQKK